ncbi:MAG: cell filamentation protein Fic [Balneola sp.]|jgi:Fic-DOC domain mobile mystery protein B|nr:cell filamentation protein Fic [Balneola sp.]MBE77850.1 cell filamentation protein Fic [Balneola sp.]|tara:strand:+ start:223 stop:819 length:597 start_codon:yes stop_codon:yes gene_type:complete
MGLTFDYITNQDILTEEDQDGLLIPSISTLEELKEFEHLNIEKAVEWSLKRRFNLKTVFSEDFIKTLHKKMFSDVWKWAGTFRTTNTGSGVDKLEIHTELRSLIEDTLHWIINKTYDPDEIALRFQSRLVSIHCFPSGNSRHSRLIADIIITHIFKKPVFSWGRNLTADNKIIREKYAQAQQEAGHGDFSLLIEFARS